MGAVSLLHLISSSLKPNTHGKVVYVQISDMHGNILLKTTQNQIINHKHKNIISSFLFFFNSMVKNGIYLLNIYFITKYFFTRWLENLRSQGLRCKVSSLSIPIRSRNTVGPFINDVTQFDDGEGKSNDL